MRVSWIPSSSEDQSDIGIEAEEELGESQGSATYLEEWNQPERRKGYSFQPAFTKPSAGGAWGSSKSIEDLGGGGGDAIQENIRKVEEIMGIEEVGEEVDRNFIRVTIGGEPYLLGDY